MNTSLVNAVQYLRMSTDHQQYSLANQADTIAEYAANHGFTLVRTYFDAARSGLLLKNRPGLKQLLQDVVRGHGEFRAILVYDISRWGRFQDTDEAAHYEYVCKSAGVPIHYCAEVFPNDNSMPGLVMKALKRSMAGEYSRELSGKVRAGLARVIRLGYRPGGVAVYGMRRMLLDSSGKAKQLLKPGQRKTLTSERVILVPGPPDEISIVERIFHEFANGYLTLRSIAKRLNQDGIPYKNGMKWDASDIRRLLKNPLYIGRQVWGRNRYFLRGKAESVPQEEWVSCKNAFEPIIDEELFDRAQTRFANLTCNLSDEELIERIRKVLQAEGRLNTGVIERSLSCPSLTTYHARFGGLLSVYKRIGYPEPKHASAEIARQKAWLIRDELIEAFVYLSSGQIETVRRSFRFRALLRYRKTGLLISVLLARYRETRRHEPRWIVVPHLKEYRRVTVLVLLDESNSSVKWMYVLPNIGRAKFALRLNAKTIQTGILLKEPANLLTALRQLRRS